MNEKRFHIVIASFVFALLMWVSLNMGYEYTVSRQIPVVLENMPEGKALKHAVPKSMGVRFRGTGWQLAGLYFSTGIKYYIDASALTAEEYIVTGTEFHEHVRLPLSLEPVAVSPESLHLALDEYHEKRVPVVPRIILNSREGFGQVGAIGIEPESVTVSGARTVLAGIEEWRTLHRRFEDRHLAIDEELPLEEPFSHSVTLHPRTVRLKVDVQHFAEKTFSGIPIQALATPANREVIFIPPRMDIIARGGIDQLARLTNANFEATVDFAALVNDSSGVTVPVLAAPAEVRVIRRIPERFQFIIRKRL